MQGAAAADEVSDYLTKSDPDPELNYDINNDGVEDSLDVGPPQPV
jgi:hypothetical protein